MGVATAAVDGGTYCPSSWGTALAIATAMPAEWQGNCNSKGRAAVDWGNRNGYCLQLAGQRLLNGSQ